MYQARRFHFLSVGASWSHCRSVHRSLKWNTSLSESSGRRQVILWNVGNHWVGGVCRLREIQQNKQISVLLHFISRTELNRWRIPSADKKCVCAYVCAWTDAFTHKTMSKSSSPETERTMPSFFFCYKYNRQSVIFFSCFWATLKCWHCIKSFCLFVFHFGTVL